MRARFLRMASPFCVMPRDPVDTTTGSPGTLLRSLIFTLDVEMCCARWSPDLERLYNYEGTTKLAHVMFPSHAGTPVPLHWKDVDQGSTLRQAEQCLKAIHALEVLYRDIKPWNILWDCNGRQVTVIDFERARVSPDRRILGPSSSNRKMKQSLFSSLQMLS